MAATYFLRRGDRVQGPIPAAKIRPLHAAGRIRSSDEIATSADGPWRRYSEVYQSLLKSLAAEPASSQSAGPATGKPSSPKRNAAKKKKSTRTATKRRTSTAAAATTGDIDFAMPQEPTPAVRDARRASQDDDWGDLSALERGAEAVGEPEDPDDPLLDPWDETRDFKDDGDKEPGLIRSVFVAIGELNDAIPAFVKVLVAFAALLSLVVVVPIVSRQLGGPPPDSRFGDDANDEMHIRRLLDEGKPEFAEMHELRIKIRHQMQKLSDAYDDQRDIGMLHRNEYESKQKMLGELARSLLIGRAYYIEATPAELVELQTLAFERSFQHLIDMVEDEADAKKTWLDEQKKKKKNAANADAADANEA